MDAISLLYLLKFYNNSRESNTFPHSVFEDISYSVRISLTFSAGSQIVVEYFQK